MSIRLGVIGGREAYTLLHKGEVRGERRFAIQTPFGEAQPIYRIASDAGACFFLARQGDEGPDLPPGAVNYQANVYALKELGVQAVLAWSGPAALTADLAPGRFVLPDDVIDCTRRRPATFFDRSRLGFIAQAPVFCDRLRGVVRSALDGLGIDAANDGAYVCTEGPRFETAAEARLYASWGGTLVGMTLCPEVFLVRELAMCYAPLCFVTGHAAGLAERQYVAGTVYQGLADGGLAAPVDEAAGRFPEIIDALIGRLADEPDDWPCRRALVADRGEADRADDWHQWLRE